MSDYCREEQRSTLKKRVWIAPLTPKKNCVEDADLREWYGEDPCGAIYFFDMLTAPSGPVAVIADPPFAVIDPERKIFEELAAQWKRETWFVSSLKKRMSHLAYRKIIGMGPVALQYIFEALKQEPAYWFEALESITRENPAPHAQSMSELRDAWLEWGAKHGY